MKIYPDQDVDFHTEKVPCWDSYRRKIDGWPTSETNYRPKEMLYWLDHDGVKKSHITDEDLYFENWPKSRIRNQACLGMNYATGIRFIKITKKPPAGFKCAPLPTNLATAHIVNGNYNKYIKFMISLS